MYVCVRVCVRGERVCKWLWCNVVPRSGGYEVWMGPFRPPVCCYNRTWGFVEDDKQLLRCPVQVQEAHVYVWTAYICSRPSQVHPRGAPASATCPPKPLASLCFPSAARHHTLLSMLAWRPPKGVVTSAGGEEQKGVEGEKRLRWDARQGAGGCCDDGRGPCFVPESKSDRSPPAPIVQDGAGVARD